MKISIKQLHIHIHQSNPLAEAMVKAVFESSEDEPENETEKALQAVETAIRRKQEEWEAKNES